MVLRLSNWLLKGIAVATDQPSFLVRHEFLIRRLHSLSGLIPVGAYMCIHLLTNATILDSSATYQKAVFGIHSLGSMLVFVEWTFIFLPILFHAIVGVVIIRGGLSNSGQYRYGSNVRYTLQRITGMIAFVFIMWHVFHMHGWIHADWWIDGVAGKLEGGKFKPYNASSTGGEAMQASFIVPLLYAIGVLASVFHLANGIWTMGITWGVWIKPKAQKIALQVCTVFGIAIAVVGLSAIWGFSNVDVDAAREKEDEMYKAKVESGDVKPDEHKRAHETPDEDATAKKPDDTGEDN